MKKTIMAIAFLALATVACKTEGKKVDTKDAEIVKEKVVNPINSYKANIADSKITWTGSKPTGSHNGDLKITSGVFDIENGIVKAGEFTIDMNSINCLDLEAGKGKEKLEGHLKNADFFDVEKFPTAKFVVTNSEVKDGANVITGNLTLKETTKSISIPVTVSEADGIATIISESFKIDRTEFGVTYKSKSIDAALKDKFIDDLMEFTIAIKAKK